LKVLVLDASVAVKWYLPRHDEPLVDAAFELLTQHAKEQIGFVTPDSFWAEFGNVMWKAVRQRRLLENDARLAISDLGKWRIGTVPLAGLLDEALRIAIANGRSFYDSLYVALAVQSDLELITADERLVNTLAARFPVKWLGSFSIT
jgi:predicted nucleic acid-binding protein